MYHAVCLMWQGSCCGRWSWPGGHSGSTMLRCRWGTRSTPLGVTAPGRTTAPSGTWMCTCWTQVCAVLHHVRCIMKYRIMCHCLYILTPAGPYNQGCKCHESCKKCRNFQEFFFQLLKFSRVPLESSAAQNSVDINNYL